ncbi:hypothetical protein T439DRAFT_377165 [Meredithblackwellia eburnea MCA 4105]
MHSPRHRSISSQHLDLGRPVLVESSPVKLSNKDDNFFNLQKNSALMVRRLRKSNSSIPLPRIAGTLFCIVLVLLIRRLLTVSSPAASGNHNSSLASRDQHQWFNRSEVCDSLPPPQFHPNPSHRTVLASYPRSGNSLLRSLVQRTTGYASGSMYCDQELVGALVGECNNTDFFFYKSHFPSGGLLNAQVQQNPNYWRSFDQVVYLERNPLDAFYSDWHRIQTGGSMTARAKVGRLGEEPAHWESVASMVSIYRAHHQYWDAVPIPKITVQYEALRSVHLRPVLDHLSSFLLGDDEPVDEDRLFCALMNDPSKDVYKSRKSPNFHSWDRWTPELRGKVLTSLLPTLCRSGYLEKMKASINDAFLHSLQCPLLDKSNEISTIIKDTVDLNGHQRPMSIHASKAQQPDLEEIVKFCPSLALKGTELADSQKQWQEAVLGHQACHKRDQSEMNRLLKSAVRQCFSWCAFDLGDEFVDDGPDGASMMTRLSPTYDDGERKGWVFNGECWTPFDETHQVCASEWPWVRGRLGLPISETP